MSSEFQWNDSNPKCHFTSQLADLQSFDDTTQHELTQSFTLAMSMGLFGSVIAGICIDRVGLEMSTALTLALGQVQMLMIVLFGSNRLVMVLSFWVYSVFRAFLYPVFISSLTIKLGFKYFGMLLGIGFALGGLTQLFMASLAGLVSGTCHYTETSSLDPEQAALCDHGSWMILHILQFLLLSALLYIPHYDRQDRIKEQARMFELLNSPGSEFAYEYGAVEAEENEKSSTNIE